MVKWICEEKPMIRGDGATVGVYLEREKELILCKDCKWYDERISMCENCGLPREQTFFCADGKRKGETEIIRCKDCKHFVSENQPCEYHGMYLSLKPDNYCSHGERR